MQRIPRFIFLFLGGGLLLVMAALTWPKPVSAQCGSQASSCRNCHEVQGQDPINAKGEWHVAHAFGDFCEFCHAGNVQATDKAEAHVGMVKPLADVQTACASCHPADYGELAQGYAVALGVTLDVSAPGGDDGNLPSGGEPAGGEPAAVEPAAPAQAAPEVAPSSELVVNDPNAVDYVQRYKEVVLGQQPINWGNLILAAMLVMMVGGGGAFVLHNEGWISITTRPMQPVPQGLPAPVVELLPELNKLDAQGLAALGRLLRRPKVATELLKSLAKLIE